MNPYVSPVYGDSTLGFPPTLIQGGTKEILLSGFIRLYQALDQADSLPVQSLPGTGGNSSSTLTECRMGTRLSA